MVAVCYFVIAARNCDDWMWIYLWILGIRNYFTTGGFEVLEGPNLFSRRMLEGSLTVLKNDIISSK